ncbi:MAG: ArnT family glycosyltransferase [Spirulina sp.]
MGQSLIDGHLPYTELWDVKPPGAFFIYAIFMLLLGKSVVSIRLAGALCVASISFFIYLVGNRLWNNRVGILAGMLVVLLSSFLPSAQSTMTEHVALIPLVGALALLVNQRSTLPILFYAGILMALASMIRLNLAYVTVIVGCFALFETIPRAGFDFFKRGLAYAAGISISIGLVFLPYIITDRLELLWNSMILAPLSYAGSQSSILETFERQMRIIGNSIYKIQGSLFGISILIWIGGLMGIVFSIVQWKNTSREKKRGLIWIYLFLIGTEISILKGGVVYGHYLIQLVPFLALPAAAFLNTLLSRSVRWPAITVAMLALVTSLKPVVENYRERVSQFLATQELHDGAAYEIAAYLKQKNILDESVYMMNDHIVLWLLDKKPLSKSITHPSNIAKDYMLEFIVGTDTSTEIELAKILTKRPKFIVKHKRVWYLSKKQVASSLLEETLNTDYKMVKEIQGRQIYLRNEN